MVTNSFFPLGPSLLAYAITLQGYCSERMGNFSGPNKIVALQQSGKFQVVFLESDISSKTVQPAHRQASLAWIKFPGMEIERGHRWISSAMKLLEGLVHEKQREQTK